MAVLFLPSYVLEICVVKSYRRTRHSFQLGQKLNHIKNTRCCLIKKGPIQASWFIFVLFLSNLNWKSAARWKSQIETLSYGNSPNTWRCLMFNLIKFHYELRQPNYSIRDYHSLHRYYHFHSQYTTPLYVNVSYEDFTKKDLIGEVLSKSFILDSIVQQEFYCTF